MARKPDILTEDTEGWVDSRVRYEPRGGGRAEYGTVLRMASARTPACFVIYDGQSTPKFTYCCDLEKVL